VLPAVSSCAWDLVIVDEAHSCGADSDRRGAVDALAAQASYVLLLTATPHNGDRGGFAALCGVGAVDETPLVVFRRTRADVGLSTLRRVHVLRVRTSPAERLMHQALGRYSDALRRERSRAGAADPCLALSVLHKRAFSSAWSLAASVERRLTELAGAADANERGGFEQLALPIGDPDGELVAADEPPVWPTDLRLEDASRERRLLEALMTAARNASLAETKLRVLRTLLRRIREPAIVFTEYRDTLQHVRRHISGEAVVLHGGLRREERIEALAAFQSAPAAVLLATDAAAEGLNLQARCRLVLNLELPWNPMRLEQRIGRVDRIGQQRTVHAFHLVAQDTGEARIAERLRSRVAAAAADIGASDPLGNDMTIARTAIGGDQVHDAEDTEAGGGSSR
jgi:superfamily II DNA or RNA helicase